MKFIIDQVKSGDLEGFEIEKIKGHSVTVITLDTLEDLMALYEKMDGALIIQDVGYFGMPQITIYNDYLE